MKLHTRKQAPKEGEAAPSPEKEPYTPTHQDYLRFLIDSQHVYQALEEVVNERPELEAFRDTGMERTKPLEEDIGFMCNEYGLKREEVGQPGKDYAKQIREMESVPELVCQYYNFYFAHTAVSLGPTVSRQSRHKANANASLASMLRFFALLTLCLTAAISKA
jgi:hypothetical protein